MELIRETKVFHLSTKSSSCQILNGDYKSHLAYDIPQMITTDDTVQYIEYSLPYAIIPVSFYTINENNNQLDILLGNTSFSVNFEFGNYNAQFFINQFKTLLSSYGFSISLDTINNKFTISNSQSFSVLGTSTIDYIMGFNDTIVSALINGNYQITSPRPCNFLALPRVCIRCPELAGNSVMVGTNSMTSDVILSVPNNTKPNGQIVFQNDTKHLLNGDILDGLTFKITDDENNLLNFNGISCFFIIQFDIWRKRMIKPPTFTELKGIGNSQLGQNNYI